MTHGDDEHDDPVGGDLRRQAAAMPAFSPLLHARVMRAVGGPAARRHRWPWAAAAVLAAATTAALLTRHRPPPSPVVVHPPVPAHLPELDVDLARLSDPAVEQLRAARYAYLDRDARSLAGFFSRQLDVLPPTP